MHSDEKQTKRRLDSLILCILITALVLSVTNLLLPLIYVLMLVFLGVLLGIVLHEPTHLLSRFTKLNYHWSFAIVLSLIISLFGGGVYYIGARFVMQAVTLKSQLETTIIDLDSRIQRNEQLHDLIPSLTEFKDHLLRFLGGFSTVMETTRAMSSVVGGLLVILFVGLYLAVDPALYKAGIIKLVPHASRGRAREVLDQLHAALTAWIKGQLLSMSIVGVCTAIGLWVLDVPLPVALGIFAAVVTFIPNFGPVVAAVPQMLLALKTGTDTVIYVLMFNIALQTVESYVLTPLIQRYQVTIPPALTIVAQLLFGVMFGVMGLIVAAPVVVAGMVFVQMIYIQDFLNDAQPGELAEP